MGSRIIGLSPLVLLLVGCAGGDGDANDPPTSPPGLSERLLGGGSGNLMPPGANRPVELKEGAGVVLDESGIIFTDPDAEDPDEAVPELRALLDSKPDEGPWGRSHTKALKTAMRTGKPVLIWFTEAGNAPCRAMTDELLNDSEFDRWAAETFVRLQVEPNADGGTLGNDAAAKARYVKQLKERYRILGQPTLVVLSPAGDVIGRYRGYRRGQANYKWGQLKHAAALAEESHAEWIKRMEKKGYRMWSDPRGRQLFARMVSCYEGRLVLVEPDGGRVQTKVRNLSPTDQDWIEAQKRAYGH